MAAESGMYPDVMPLATVMRSGTTWSCSQANQRPVRPNPVMTSSAIISTSSSSQMARTAASQPIGGMMKPPEEITGSMITADTVSGPSLTIASRSSRAALHQRLLGAGAAIAERVRRHDLRETRNVKVGVRRRQVRQPADREGARRSTVVTTLERDDLVLAGLAGGEPVVPSHLHAALVGLGSAHGEERIVEIARRERGDLGRQLGGRPVRELASRR